ncbi:hypothetical protein ACEPAI_3282 [Sanghuangporus weigelae]
MGASSSQSLQSSELKRLAFMVLKDGNIEESNSSLEVQVREAVKAPLGKCRACGMSVNPDFIIQVIQLHHPSREDLHRDEDVDKVSSLFESLAPVVLALMSNKDNHIYAGLRRSHGQYLANLVLKINTKLNGINDRLEPASLKWLANTMVVGFDVIKLDGKAVKGAPGTAAVAASCDMNFVQYHASVSFKLQGLEEEHARIMTAEIKQLKHSGSPDLVLPDEGRRCGQDLVLSGGTGHRPEEHY